MSIRIKNVNLNTKTKFDGRVLAVGINDVSSLASCALLNYFAEKNNIDCVVQVDIRTDRMMTDKLIEKAIEGIDNLSLEMFREVYIVGRSTCTEPLLRKLFKWGVQRVIHIDSHFQNIRQSKEFAKDFDLYECISVDGYSTCWATYKYITSVDSFIETPFMKPIVALVDGWESFKWIKSNNIETDPLGINFIKEHYGIENTNTIEEIKLLPFDTSVIELSYIGKFEESDTLFKLISNLIITGKGLKRYSIVIDKYKKTERRTSRYIQYSYNDTMKGIGGDSRVFRINVPQKDNKEAVFSVFYIDRALDDEVASASIHYFLQKYSNMIVIYKTKDMSSTFSIRSLGDIDITPLYRIFRGGGNSNSGGFTLRDVEKTLEKSKSNIVSTLRENAR